MTDDVKTRDKEDDDEDRTTSISLSSVSKVSTDSSNYDNVRSFSRTSTSKKEITEKSQIMRPTEPPVIQSNVPDDDIDLFFPSFAKTVKKLSQNEQVHLKMGISKLVFEAELRNLSPVTQSLVMTITMPNSSLIRSSSALFRIE
ncbi:hypothetical protein FQA39_LY14949 [Lamprigera yunnana]|nr:hypothetical protein FQA39_LY14949 [Lamprigera yunnana]